MAEKKRKRYNYRMRKATSTHGFLLLCVGGYLGWMAYQMVKNTLTGNSSMSMTQTVILSAVMGAVAAAVLGYGVYVLYLSRKRSELTEEEAAEVDRQIAQADMENYGYVIGQDDAFDDGNSEDGA